MGRHIFWRIVIGAVAVKVDFSADVGCDFSADLGTTRRFFGRCGGQRGDFAADVGTTRRFFGRCGGQRGDFAADVGAIFRQMRRCQRHRWRCCRGGSVFNTHGATAGVAQVDFAADVGRDFSADLGTTRRFFGRCGGQRGDFSTDAEVPAAPSRILWNPPMGDFSADAEVPAVKVDFSADVGRDFSTDLGTTRRFFGRCGGASGTGGAAAGVEVSSTHMVLPPGWHRLILRQMWRYMEIGNG